MIVQNRGRDMFLAFKPLILLCTMGFSLLPKQIRVFFWHRIEWWHGFIGVGLRYCILKSMCESCGSNVFIGPNVEIRGWKCLKIGSNVSIHQGCYIDANGTIEIGDNVSIAHGCSIVSFNHSWEDPMIPIRDQPVKYERIAIGDDVWIGCQCKILPGASIGRRSILAAGSVLVTKLMPNTLSGGIPAKPIKTIG